MRVSKGFCQTNILSQSKVVGPFKEIGCLGGWGREVQAREWHVQTQLGWTSLHPSNHKLNSASLPCTPPPNYQNCFWSAPCVPWQLPALQSQRTISGDFVKPVSSGLESKVQEWWSCSDLESQSWYFQSWSLLRVSTTIAHSPVTTWFLLPAGCLKSPPGLQVWALSPATRSGLESMAGVLFSLLTQSLAITWALSKHCQLQLDYFDIHWQPGWSLSSLESISSWSGRNPPFIDSWAFFLSLSHSQNVISQDISSSLTEDSIQVCYIKLHNSVLLFIWNCLLELCTWQPDILTLWPVTFQ